MPVADKQDDSIHDSREDRENDRDRKSKQQPSAAAAGKTKDLSHVPCKFFRVGSCTAGSSCPFSHTILEPGQQKEVCAWFVKGNCKFGHKCALAHILPGQSMSMDRKNKKAAQAAANAGNKDGNKEGGHRGGGERGGKQRSGGGQGSQGGSNSRNTLLSGSTAPTRSISSSRGPMQMPLKSTLSPSAPAPPVKDTDFASFGLLPDENNKLPNAPAQTKSSSSSTSLADAGESAELSDHQNTEAREPDTSPLPENTSAARAASSPHAVDFGPIGSPPRISPAAQRTARVNGFSPGTSPHRNAPISSSPFSAPGTQTNFMIHEQVESSDFKSRSGLSASLGAILNWAAPTTERPQSRHNGAFGGETVVEDGDLEEFIPGSLTDLLTPEERSRRFSRTTSTRPTVPLGNQEGLPGSMTQTGEGHHRYSRSVPAPSLLQDIRSIWSDAAGGIPGSPDAAAVGSTTLGGGLGNGTPSSFQSNTGFGGRGVDEMLAPTNASAAFLPGLHHYINTKAAASRTATPGGMQSLYPQTATSTSHPHHISGGVGVGGAYSAGLNGMALSPPRVNSYTNHAFDNIQTESFLSQRRPPVHNQYNSSDILQDHQRNNIAALSPSARALQSHAPGQSLPQGLAAGYSRIHALPPPPVIPSPSTSGTSGAFSPPGRMSGFGLGHHGSGGASGEWRSLTPQTSSISEQFSTTTTTIGQGGTTNVNVTSTTSVTAMAASPSQTGTSLGGFSRLSYSAAASRPSGGAPPGLSRNPSGGRGWPSNPSVQGQPSQGQGIGGPLSPLSRPALTGPVEDDELFTMDG
ncbi:hypothetical protein ABKN59_009932 [Abortiporus biennis]